MSKQEHQEQDLEQQKWLVYSMRCPNWMQEDLFSLEISPSWIVEEALWIVEYLDECSSSEVFFL